MTKPRPYPESLIPILLQSHLSIIGFPDRPYRIVPISQNAEGVLGYDAHVKLQYYTFYMQFKCPDAVRSSSPYTEQRETAGVSNMPSVLCFSLHRRKKQPHYQQHDAMFKLSNTLANRVAYVCPIFVELAPYQASMQVGILELLLHYLGLLEVVKSTSVLIHSAAQPIAGNTAGVTIRDVPAFKAHISVPPHAQISDSDYHKYSFTSNGHAVCFHSPRAVPVSSRPLGSWLQSVVDAALESRTSGVSRSTLAELFPELDEQLSADAREIEILRIFGSYLERQFGIFQYAVVRELIKEEK
ncbi:MAG: hypothetical protein U0105_27555 [Candidatus Obscuribacterales bacterium]